MPILGPASSFPETGFHLAARLTQPPEELLELLQVKWINK